MGAEATLAFGMVLVGTCATFAGPAGTWVVAAVGLSALLALGGGAQIWQRRAPR